MITHKKSLRGIYLYLDIGDINLPIFLSFPCQFFFSKKHICNVMPLVLERNLCESALFWQPVALNYSCWIFAKSYSMQELKNWPNSWIRYSYFLRGQQSMVKVSFYMQSFCSLGIVNGIVLWKWLISTLFYAKLRNEKDLKNE